MQISHNLVENEEHFYLLLLNWNGCLICIWKWMPYTPSHITQKIFLNCPLKHFVTHVHIRIYFSCSVSVFLVLNHKCTYALQMLRRGFLCWITCAQSDSWMNKYVYIKSNLSSIIFHLSSSIYIPSLMQLHIVLTFNGYVFNQTRNNTFHLNEGYVY